MATISDRDDRDDTIVYSAVALAHNLDLAVIAEGIERPARELDTGRDRGQNR